MTYYNNNNEHTFENKMLIIPDFVIYDDIPVIYNYFDYYNIAKVKNVSLYEFPDRDYNTECYHIYYYAIVEIDEWQNNNCSKNFYQRIHDEQCYMVYDDPNYWELYFYNENKYYSYNETDYTTISNIEIEPQDNQVISHVDNHESEKEDECESEEELNESDDLYDETYEFEETDDEQDLAFEFYYKKVDSPKYYTRSQAKNKRKFNEEFDQLKKEVKELKDVIIKKNKNYLKKNKTKVAKNEWTRHLRQNLFH
jgi:hypothetical protein